MLETVAGFAVAAAAALALTPLAIRIAPRLGLIDQPGERRMHTTPIPRAGGLAVFLAAAFGVAAARMTAGIAADTFAAGVGLPDVMLVGLLALVVGVFDDAAGATPRFKLVMTLTIAAFAWVIGFRIDGIGVREVFDVRIDSPATSFAVTVLWMTGVTHSFNLIDGLDGLASGLAAVACAAVGVSAAIGGHTDLMVLSAVVGGAALGFLAYNRHPARIFLGDAGSLTLGMLLSMLTVMPEDRSGSMSLGLFPLLVLAYPLLDTSLAVLRRFLRGVSFSQADRRHIHHRLLDVGPDYRWTVRVLHALSFIAAAAAVLLRHGSRDVVFVTLGAVVVCLAGVLVLMVTWLGYHELFVAGRSVASVVTGARRVVREKILARDLAERLKTTQTIAGVESLLETLRDDFGIARAEVVRESSRRPMSLVAEQSGGGSPYWRIDWPVSSLTIERDDLLVLRLWAPSDGGPSPQAVARLAATIAPALGACLTLPALHELMGLQHGVRFAAGEARRTGKESAESGSGAAH